MEIHIKNSTIVQPSKETPTCCHRNTDLDLSVPATHMLFVFLHRRPNDSSDFSHADLLKGSLSNALVPFYPMAGRFGADENGRLEIRCNGEGVLFLEADTKCAVDDLGDFESDSKLLQLVPTATHFRCGGVCLGIMPHHILADGTSSFHFINTWSEMTRGLPISIPPIFNPTLLDTGGRASPPSINTLTQGIELQSNPESNSTAILKLSLDQINFLKEKSNQDHGTNMNYSRFEILAAHIWRCACKARGLSDDQSSKLYIAINGRPRMKPAIPSNYFGNLVFSAKSISLSRDIKSEPLNDRINRIHKPIKQMDDKYLKSALVYLKRRSDLMVLKQRFEIYKSPNLYISQASNIPVNEADFGWGRPMFELNGYSIFYPVQRMRGAYRWL